MNEETRQLLEEHYAGLQEAAMKGINVQLNPVIKQVDKNTIAIFGNGGAKGLKSEIVANKENITNNRKSIGTITKILISAGVIIATAIITVGCTFIALG